ncbi:MmcQ/YjbR family DNA-binding protein [Cellulophaga tyrosinoxydans]|uniref:Predicted DNA-binding protein, MmcQ/YjbR family n=1 Tax=Cellulophaga tyrosinoxydans TaxID=504486 RepID=A0A1W1YFD6_9FLAO|nr:MmcQ/YjbR family DNA-binding protein [Cellulophaga tyrosinoxydans]SMC34920.1 Predicted DNA-binding protein, MmcQ/YjbR family [Cellulophaga tyrosinoxydans]
MDIETLRSYFISKKGVTEDFPFDDVTLVFKVMGKMFALVSLERLPLQVNLKCNPEKAIELREEHDGAILPGYHMSKVHWNTLIVEKISPKLILELIDHSYDLVVSKLTKKLKDELASLD